MLAGHYIKQVPDHFVPTRLPGQLMAILVIGWQSRILTRFVISWGVYLCVFSAAGAGDWPQILGPARNGKAEGEHLANQWPAAGPKVSWQRKVGSGYAGVAVAGGRLVLWHRVGDESVAEGLDAASGEPRWKTSFPTSYSSTIAPDDGPRCVPLIHQNRVYLVGAQGDVHCVALKDGHKLWNRDVFRELGAPEGYFGAGSTPIVESDKLLMNVGGPGAGIVALSLAYGSTVWKSTDEAASYSSPIGFTNDGHRQVIFATRLTTISIDPTNGKVHWRYPFGMRGPTVNAATPLVIDNNLFLSASYGIGARWLKLTPDKAEEVWESDEIMSSQYTTCIEHEGVFYGIDGRQDAGVAQLRAFDPKSRKVYWTEDGFGSANLILADGKLLIMKIDGELIMAEPSRERFRQLTKAKVLETTAQPLPALANGMLYVRDTSTLKALRLH
jgi:outer membrane protein assembly factor BamB